MSFFKKAIASITGIGGSRIDTRLEKDTYVQGEIVRGEVIIFGGEIVQELDDAYVTFMTDTEAELGRHDMRVPVILASVKIDLDRKIMPNEQVSIPFSFKLADDTPITLHKSRTWVHTKLDVESGMDPVDQDFIKVVPAEGLNTVLNALYEIGFQMRECENKIERRQIIQEFEFYPTNGQFRGLLDELELNYFDKGSEIHVYLQVDRRARDFRTAMQERRGMDETKVRIVFPKHVITNMEEVKQALANVISQHS